MNHDDYSNFTVAWALAWEAADLAAKLEAESGPNEAAENLLQRAVHLFNQQFRNWVPSWMQQHRPN